jgi:hypothetical protein
VPEKPKLNSTNHASTRAEREIEMKYMATSE